MPRVSPRSDFAAKRPLGTTGMLWHPIAGRGRADAVLVGWTWWRGGGGGGFAWFGPPPRGCRPAPWPEMPAHGRRMVQQRAWPQWLTVASWRSLGCDLFQLATVRLPRGAHGQPTMKADISKCRVFFGHGHIAGTLGFRQISLVPVPQQCLAPENSEILRNPTVGDFGAGLWPVV